MYTKSEDFCGFNGDSQTVMEINGLRCILNMPKALKSEVNEEGKEVIQSLPPYSPRKAFKVDEYECPTNWMHGSSLANSYFVPVASEHAMWLDFNSNFYGSDRDVAILISVQGVNPLDGQSMVEGAMHLRQYKSKCPVHDVDFGADRYCEKCGYKWVPQNYLCTTGTPGGHLWLDGFLAADGVVRQYYFTEEEAKGVAHQVIGAEKKVYSIGIAFYLSKEPKPVPDYGILRSMPYFSASPAMGSFGSWNAGGLESTGGKLYSYDTEVSCSTSGQHTNSVVNKKRMMHRAKTLSMNASPEVDMDADYDCEETGAGEMNVKMLEVGAGAKINQKVYADTKELDYWQDKPAGILYVNYTLSEQAIAILKKGKKDLTKKGEGYLAGLNSGR